MGQVDLNAEAYEIVRKFWGHFYNGHQNNFIVPDKSRGAYDGNGHYTLWPVAVAVQAIVDAARIYPDQIRPMLRPAFKCYEAYYSPKRHAYCASFNFDGNEDIYYDDNAQVASTFLTAYEVTQDKYYLDRAVENVQFLMTGEERTKFGGVRWHVAKEGSNTCTTAEVGVACMRLARFVTPNDAYINFARMCADWVFTRVQDTNDKLICDGLEPDGNGFKRNETKWTYNQGTPLTMCALLYSATHDDQYKKWAEGLAGAVTNPNTAIYDRDTPNMQARYYRDGTNFYQLLAEGLADFLLFFSESSDAKLVNQVRGELLHTIQYVYKYMRDPQDGLYFQKFQIFEIDQQRADAFKELTGETHKPFKPSEDEREKGDGPPENRKLCKNLMGCAAAARIFFQTARAHPKIDA